MSVCFLFVVVALFLSDFVCRWLGRLGQPLNSTVFIAGNACRTQLLRPHANWHQRYDPIRRLSLYVSVFAPSLPVVLCGHAAVAYEPPTTRRPSRPSWRSMARVATRPAQQPSCRRQPARAEGGVVGPSRLSRRLLCIGPDYQAPYLDKGH